MRYAIISDIHSNLEAFTAVIESIDKERVDRIVCLGDIVGYYTNPNECLDIIRERKIQCVTGNHDRVATGLKEPTNFGEAGRRAIFWTRKQLTPDNLSFLEELPFFKKVEGRFIVVHGALHPEPNEDNYLSTEPDLIKSFNSLMKDYYDVKICFFGHTHKSTVLEYRGGTMLKLKSDHIKLNPDTYYMINPGSVGQSRGHDPRASFLIFDSDENTVQFHHVVYDYVASYQKADSEGLIYREGLLLMLINRTLECIEAGKRLIKSRLPDNDSNR